MNGTAKVREYFDEKYPPRGSWVVRHAGHEGDVDYYYGGYYSEKLRKCPVCGRYPVFTECSSKATPPGEKARVFLGYCPTCCLRTKTPGTLKETVMQWMHREYSEDSWMVCHRPMLDTYGCRLLSKHVVEAAIDDAIFYAQKRQDEAEGTETWEFYGRELKKLETFFRESVFMFELDPDGVISDIRRILYPNLEPKDRIKIPLHLNQLYKGKKVVKKCMDQKSSKKQP